ncbi:Phenazine biosynthesis protein PhzF family [Xenorhabdus innexi]|uniref:Phenazine biosynthesis protein n=2 Tax=Xenorhabdus innexi TaxID=290109 RepID=A0A1N6MXN8_9GAMM|nr:putative phenazine biosynthesis protein [Xenorhabdus innexi]SIP73648.1 Phenazine biosynthesis protein PhzF family [Xenorhabdus innexi]
MKLLFEQVTVFSDKKLQGNPLAVVTNADNLSDQQMAQFAKWTNLSETTFLLSPLHPDADYRVRIFTPAGELPFAGHPTLGTCYVWQKISGQKNKETIIQECKAGLIPIRQVNGRPAFMAPPLVRMGDVADDIFEQILKGLGITSDDVELCQWIDNGPGWLGILLKSVDKLMGIRPDYSQLKDYELGLCAMYPENSQVRLEVRGLCGSISSEDPVTGSLNAAFAQWLIPHGKLPENYIARQGRCVERDGWIYVTSDENGIWISGDVVDCISGTVEFD